MSAFIKSVLGINEDQPLDTPKPTVTADPEVANTATVPAQWAFLPSSANVVRATAEVSWELHNGAFVFMAVVPPSECCAILLACPTKKRSMLFTCARNAAYNDNWVVLMTSLLRITILELPEMATYDNFARLLQNGDAGCLLVRWNECLFNPVLFWQPLQGYAPKNKPE